MTAVIENFTPVKIAKMGPPERKLFSVNLVFQFQIEHACKYENFYGLLKVQSSKKSISLNVVSLI